MQDLVYITTVKIQCTCIIAMSVTSDVYNQCNDGDNSTDYGKDSEDY
jgi:hypothetical protein